MNRIKRGWQLSKKSWSVLRSNRDLIRFPLYGGVLATLVTLVVVGPGLFFLEENMLGIGVPLAVLGVYAATFIGFYFSVGLAASADRIFHGEDASVSDGLAVANQRLPQIAGWAVIATVVSVLISLIRERAGFLGAILGSVLSLGWALISFLAVPVIAIEGTGAVHTLKRSASIFRERWGQQITGNVAIGGLTFVLGVLPAIALIAGGVMLWTTVSFVGAALVICGIALLIAALLIQRAMSVIFGVALYRYALAGEEVGGFTAEELESVVKIKGGGGRPATVGGGVI